MWISFRFTRLRASGGALGLEGVITNNNNNNNNTNSHGILSCEIHTLGIHVSYLYLPVNN
jgi:hypothetical protein